MSIRDDDIKIITEPRIYLISRPDIDQACLADFMKEEGINPEWQDLECSDGEMLPEIGGRLCYMSYNSPRPGGNQAYLEHILEVGHESVLEHANYGFIFTGVSRSLTHELIRHRHLSPSQLSQRYVDESDVAFVIPPALLASYNACMGKNRKSYLTSGELLAHYEAVNAYYIWRDGCWNALSYYRQMLNYLVRQAPPELTGTEKKKWARQAARSVLPNCCETKIMMTGNIRAWRGVILQRASRFADDEIRRLFNVVYNFFAAEAPNAFQDMTTKPLPDGSFEVVKVKGRE